ncbi:hypothetical protein WJX72_010924 [[Myrmecia] bisecta]|uniref:Uncharacterized protein n=1 Tax=[Myrmecia] bisecta TaxID=41462 RepID=A0AAW1PV80_9CHLO
MKAAMNSRYEGMADGSAEVIYQGSGCIRVFPKGGGAPAILEQGDSTDLNSGDILDLVAFEGSAQAVAQLAAPITASAYMLGTLGGLVTVKKEKAVAAVAADALTATLASCGPIITQLEAQLFAAPDAAADVKPNVQGTAAGGASGSGSGSGSGSAPISVGACGAPAAPQSRLATSERAAEWAKELKGLREKYASPQIIIGVVGDTGAG